MMFISYEINSRTPLRADLDQATQAFLEAGGSIKCFEPGVLAVHLMPQPEKKVVKRSAASYNPAGVAKAEETMRKVKRGLAEGMSNRQIAELAGVTKNYISYLISKNKLREPKP